MWLATLAAVAAIWHPVPGATWQIQLQGRLDLSVPAAVYDVDGFDTPAEVVVGRRGNLPVPPNPLHWSA